MKSPREPDFRNIPGPVKYVRSAASKLTKTASNDKLTKLKHHDPIKTERQAASTELLPRQQNKIKNTVGRAKRARGSTDRKLFRALQQPLHGKTQFVPIRVESATNGEPRNPRKFETRLDDSARALFLTEDEPRRITVRRHQAELGHRRTDYRESRRRRRRRRRGGGETEREIRLRNSKSSDSQIPPSHLAPSVGAPQTHPSPDQTSRFLPKSSKF